VLLKNAGLSAAFLLIAPFASTLVLAAVYGRVRAASPGLARWLLVVGTVSALAAAVHGGYDLANVLQPPASAPDLPNAIDPRGLLTFGGSGAALLAAAWLVARTSVFPRWTAPLAVVLGVVLLATYLARLIVLDATSLLVLGPALVAGLLSPLFYLGLGLWFLSRGRARS
jgi:hypothetical protein